MKTVEELVSFAAAIDGQGTVDNQNCTYTQPELRALANSLLRVPKGSCAVEVGVYTGRSTSLYFQLQRELELDIHLVDNWSWNQKLAAHQFADLVLDNFNELPFTLHKMRSDTELRWTLPINFLHIDGWHDMPGIDGDCRMFLPHVVGGGFVAFHDSDCPPVRECIQKYVQDTYQWSLIEMAWRTTVWRRHV